jgi:CBS domain-containing protein
MTETINEVMTTELCTIECTEPITKAAELMRDRNVGDVLVLENGEMCGIVTDRDIVVRAIAEGFDPGQTELKQICSQELATLRPDDTVDDAVTTMRKKHVRRLPVLENSHPIGIVSIGDLAVERDRRSALADISAAAPNH